MTDRNIDLDAIAREVGEDADAKPLTITFKGQTFRLMAPADISMFDIADSLRALDAISDDPDPTDVKAQAAALDAINGFLRLLVHPDDWAAFAATRPGPRVLGRLVVDLPRLYGMDGLGEPQASSDSFATNGNGSKPTSDASTGSTLATSSDQAAVAPA